MKEKQKQINFSRNAAKIAATILVGAAIVGYGPDAIQALDKFEQSQNIKRCSQIDPYLSVAPIAGEPSTRVTTKSSNYTQMTEIQEWNPEANRWLTTERAFDTIARRPSILPFIDDWENRSAQSDLENKQNTFLPPASSDDIQRRTAWGMNYIYCWDDQSSSWQEVSKYENTAPQH